MTFKKFIVLQERRHFVTLNNATNYIINRLEDKIAKRKNGVRSGSAFEIELGKYGTLVIKFFKGYTRRGREALKMSNQDTDVHDNVNAFYFPETKESPGTIEVYVNTSKSSQHYYKDRDFESMINKSLPKFIKDTLAHEISHAYEDIVKDVDKFKTTNPSDIQDYKNLDEELNARLNAFLHEQMRLNKNLLYHIHKGDIKEAVNVLIKKVKDDNRLMQDVTPENKIWILKTIYTFITDKVKQTSTALPS